MEFISNFFLGQTKFGIEFEPYQSVVVMKNLNRYLVKSFHIKKTNKFRSPNSHRTKLNLEKLNQINSCNNLK